MATVREDETPRPVYLASIMEPRMQMDGSINPQRVTAVRQETALIQVDSSLRKTGNDFDFIIDLLQSNSSFRQIQLKRCLLPLLPQINDANKFIRFNLDGAIVGTTLKTGYYIPEKFADELNTTLGDLWALSGGTVNVDYDPVEREISISGSTLPFGLLDDSPYAKWGKNVAKFPTISLGDTATETSITSLSMSMIFTRYIQIDSCELVRNQRGNSLIGGRGAVSIIGVVDIVGKYNTEQWSPTTNIFPGTSASFDVDPAPVINMRSDHSTPRVVDFSFKDEFGFTLDRIGSDIQYPTTLWFEVYL